jgi:hypothetical protein
MSRRVLWLASTAVLAIAIACGGTSTADGGPAPIVLKPRLAVLELSPLTVRGYSFRPRERVTVTLDGGRRGTQRVQAGRQGGFTARFKSVRMLRCQTLTIRAVGSRGSRAVRQVPRPDCRLP